MECEKKEFEMLCYLRKVGLVTKFMCPAKIAEKVAKNMIKADKYDGIMVCERSGLVKAIYGYCGR